jgi:hypothetical protein
MRSFGLISWPTAGYLLQPSVAPNANDNPNQVDLNDETPLIRQVNLVHDFGGADLTQAVHLGADARPGDFTAVRGSGSP